MANPAAASPAHGAGEISRAESGAGGRKAAQLAAMNIVDRVRVKMIDAAATGAKTHKTQKQLEEMHKKEYRDRVRTLLREHIETMAELGIVFHHTFRKDAEESITADGVDATQQQCSPLRKLA